MIKTDDKDCGSDYGSDCDGDYEGDYEGDYWDSEANGGRSQGELCKNSPKPDDAWDLIGTSRKSSGHCPSCQMAVSYNL